MAFVGLQLYGYSQLPFGIKQGPYPSLVYMMTAIGLAHVVGDSLIKSEQPGIELFLLNGKYTPQNRPIQDLYAFHVVGRQEMGLDK